MSYLRGVFSKKHSTMPGQRPIQSALISVFYKDGLEPLVRRLHDLGVSLYSTGGTQEFIEKLGLPCIAVERVTGYPSILGGRVKTLHPNVFGGILARRNFKSDEADIAQYDIPLFDLVIVDLYPFEETVSSGKDEASIIEKIDIGGVSLIRAAAKNFNDVAIISSRARYAHMLRLLEHGAATGLDTRRQLAADAFADCLHYDAAIAAYFNTDMPSDSSLGTGPSTPLRYGENPHQAARFQGDIDAIFEKLNGKELSFNNLVDTDAACQLIAEWEPSKPVFAVIKHTNVCGIAQRDSLEAAWDAALAGDRESAFGGVLVTNQAISLKAAQKINEIFFEILIAPAFEEEALKLLRSKKNRILLRQKQPLMVQNEFKRVLNGTLTQEADRSNFAEWREEGARPCSDTEAANLKFANLVCKHLKSNAIALVKDLQLIGKGCGQTSRIDALRQSLDKARQFGFSTQGAVLASDAFFPFDDCVRLAHEAGITAVIEPGGSIRDADSIQFCKVNDMALVLTGNRHFRH
ncbi:MAG: bifunctional phosphoribosylaminoimidazolecarboxamide formyltransferase/IMP cyclohydrolase [Bacteroidetes bacterium]|nr:bifunctional phosphoribosylaminoimidazolecarboxamide formyltransferase/IMP cyclohydrolase [Bacteroidota bacterium]